MLRGVVHQRRQRLVEPEPIGVDRPPRGLDSEVVIRMGGTGELRDIARQVIDPEMNRQITTWGGTYAGWQANVQALRDFWIAETSFQQALLNSTVPGALRTAGPPSPETGGEAGGH